jgi:hypothetical protein
MQPVKKLLGDLRTRLHLLSQAIREWMEGTPDGLPFLPVKLRYLVSGDRNDTKSSFFDMGRLCAQRIVKTLKKTGAEIESFDAIFDVGCGGQDFYLLRKPTEPP